MKLARGSYGKLELMAATRLDISHTTSTTTQRYCPTEGLDSTSGKDPSSTTKAVVCACYGPIDSG